MTNKKIIKILDDISCADCKHYDNIFGTCNENRRCDEGIVEAVIKLQEQDKYKWHDLRKNPEDLPPCEGDYMCRVGARKYPERPMTYEPCDFISKNSNKWHDSNGYVRNHFVIAWREFESFEEFE